MHATVLILQCPYVDLILLSLANYRHSVLRRSQETHFLDESIEYHDYVYRTQYKFNSIFNNEGFSCVVFYKYYPLAYEVLGTHALERQVYM